MLIHRLCRIRRVLAAVDPALARPEVGIAMPRGADIARATADIVLMDDRLTAVADAREIAGRTMALIKSNFNIAVGVNTAVLAGAVMGWLSPVMSAVLHNGTTIGVLLRALAGAGPSEPLGHGSSRRRAVSRRDDAGPGPAPGRGSPVSVPPPSQAGGRDLPQSPF